MKNLLRIAAEESLRVYEKYADLGCCKVNLTERLIYIGDQPGRFFLVASCKGTDPTYVDWLRNFNVTWKHGIKKHAYKSAKAIQRYLKRCNIPKHIPVLFTGHSQGGAEALSCMKELGRKKDYCVAFAPPPVFRKNIKLKNTTIVFNHRDIVPVLGWSIFDHPECNRLYFDRIGNPQIDWSFMKMYEDRIQGSKDFIELFGDHSMELYKLQVEGL